MMYFEVIFFVSYAWGSLSILNLWDHGFHYVWKVPVFFQIFFSASPSDANYSYIRLFEVVPTVHLCCLHLQRFLGAGFKMTEE